MALDPDRVRVLFVAPLQDLAGGPVPSGITPTQFSTFKSFVGSSHFANALCEDTDWADELFPAITRRQDDRVIEITLSRCHEGLVSGSNSGIRQKQVDIDLWQGAW